MVFSHGLMSNFDLCVFIAHTNTGYIHSLVSLNKKTTMAALPHLHFHNRYEASIVLRSVWLEKEKKGVQKTQNLIFWIPHQ